MPGWAAGYLSMRRCQLPENVQATLSIHITNKPFKGLHLTYRAQPFFFSLPLQPFFAPPITHLAIQRKQIAGRQ